MAIAVSRQRRGRHYHPETPVAPTEMEYLRARAFVARSLVRDGQVSPETALFYTVWPSGAVLRTEAKTNRNTIVGRANQKRLNP